MITAILKKFLRGVLYIFVLPLLLVVLSIYAVIGIFVFVFLGIKAIFLFFTGRNLFGELPEDIKARQILTGEKQEYVLETSTVNIPVQGEDLIIGEPTQTNSNPQTTLPPSQDIPQSTTPEPSENDNNYFNNGEGGF